MREVAILAVLFAVSGIVQGAPSLSLSTPSSVSFTILSGATAPVRLTAIDAGAVIGPNGTSLADSLTAGVSGPVSANLSWANDTTDAALRVRLSATSITGSVALCVSCKLQLACGSTTSDQIVIANGIVVSSQGAYVTFNATGAACSGWTVWAVGQGVLTGSSVAIAYDLDIAPASGTFPNASYVNMRMTFTG